MLLETFICYYWRFIIKIFFICLFLPPCLFLVGAIIPKSMPQFFFSGLKPFCKTLTRSTNYLLYTCYCKNTSCVWMIKKYMLYLDITTFLLCFWFIRNKYNVISLLQYTARFATYDNHMVLDSYDNYMHLIQVCNFLSSQISSNTSQNTCQFTSKTYISNW